MRLRAGLLVAGLVTAIVSVLSTPASAQAAAWTYIGVYTSKYKCVDAGQMWVREGWNEYECSGGGNYWELWVR
ncbi:hypothetical protein [Nonomuraea jabiensis]|uniref:Uncharacterized protein n=1 Tax=Nonomuraea jabiensis TaxID=882448 RepID=A0A7W9GEZ0_9ACTN|nr:hypothetical protein [Nonomuraea jabiensis]MBB5782568.1 hypothetical protein [Nonomuraea jabiensis]